MRAGEDPFRTKRRPKRMRETRTTTGNRRRREAPQRDLARLRRREPPTRRAPRGAGARAQARLLAQRGRRGAARRQQEESASLLCLQRGARRARTNAEGRDDASAGVPPADGSIDRKFETRASALGRAGARPAKEACGGLVAARLENVCLGEAFRQDVVGSRVIAGGVWQRARACRTRNDEIMTRQRTSSRATLRIASRPRS